jgi:hypothetical protein
MRCRVSRVRWATASFSVAISGRMSVRPTISRIALSAASFTVSSGSRMLKRN